MVYYFTSNVIDPPATIYVGKDKFETTQFHADNLSSAHVYLRLAPEQTWTWDALPAALVQDCAQLTKANSIEGNKKDNVTIIYTPWTNLRKNAGMATGQVGFVDPKMTQTHHIPHRLNATINRLLKTRTTLPTSSLATDRDAYQAAQRT
ncbi:hypothetical protein IMSHALPRED_000905 [Imshaugia aleurites]|uniref:NFACT RNA-binding domain-containing protein n=1 Tax=Imshaugia aleurites TaxID=172621 RepID=A0A8H3EWJ0_9LECA|nr:hypothetical protein IMSHALPRED_000905 [Imshaugia aleurites]